MSFCRPSDIGKAATLADARAVAQVLNHANVYFYDDRDWRIESPALQAVPGGGLGIWTQHRLAQSAHKDIRVAKYSPAAPSQADKWLEVVQTAAGFDYDWVMVSDDGPIEAVRIQAIVGVAETRALPVGTSLLQGDTILRTDPDSGEAEVMLMPDAGQSIADDKLLEPPQAVRLCAITIGRRLIKLQYDEKAVWDDGMNTLYDGWENDLARYA